MKIGWIETSKRKFGGTTYDRMAQNVISEHFDLEIVNTEVKNFTKAELYNAITHSLKDLKFEGLEVKHVLFVNGSDIRQNKWILPIEDELIDNLYEVFSGKIRFVMDAITTLVASLPEGITGTISTSDAKHYLHQLTEQKVKHVLTDAELSVLLQAIQQIQFTNSSLVKATKKTKQNINKYIRQFRKLNFIYQTKKEGRSVYYEVLPDLLLLQNKG